MTFKLLLLLLQLHSTETFQAAKQQQLGVAMIYNGRSTGAHLNYYGASQYRERECKFSENFSQAKAKPAQLVRV